MTEEYESKKAQKMTVVFDYKTIAQANIAILAGIV